MSRRSTRLQRLLVASTVLSTVATGALLFLDHRPLAPRGLSATYRLNAQGQGAPWRADVLDPEVSHRAPLFRSAAASSGGAFSVEWRGWVDVPLSSAYTFTVNPAGAAWLSLDGKLVVDGGNPTRQGQGSAFLSRGMHALALRYVAAGDPGPFRVSWARSGAGPAPLSDAALFPPTVSLRWLRFRQAVRDALPLLVAACCLLIGLTVPPRPAATAPRGPRAALLLACALVPLWQSTFALSASQLDGSYRLHAAGGLYDMNRYVYFYYYLGIFPLTTAHEPLAYGREGAEAVARDHPESLTMDANTNIRGGDSGRVWLFLPAAVLNGRPTDFNLVWLNAALFALALVGLLVAAWRLGHLPLGVLLVVLIGSQPFQLYQIYASREYTGGGVGSLFALPITLAVVVLALHLPLVLDGEVGSSHLWALPLVTGAILGTARQVRSELVVMAVSAALCYLAARRLGWRTRVGLAGALLVAFGAVSAGWKAYFDHRFQEAARFVEAVGGRPTRGHRDAYHTLWHPIFTGLGDFDRKHGYSWDDRVAFDYATPRLKSRLGPEWDAFVAARGDEGSPRYQEPLWVVPGYEAVLREKVLADVAHDPLWYAQILGKRLVRVLTEVVPARVAAGARSLTIPAGGALLVPTLLLFALRRQWGLVRLLCFCLPLALPAFLVYSGKGMTYYSIHLQVCLAVYGAVAWDGLRAGVEALRRRAATPETAAPAGP